MAPLAGPSIPTIAPLPHSHRLSSTSPHVFKTLTRLSRSALISLALEWLEERNLELCAPYIFQDKDEEEGPTDAPYEAEAGVEELRELYVGLQARKGSKREVVDRVMEGDWRHGLTLYQLAMAETRGLLDHPTSQRWVALRLARIDEGKDASPRSDDNTGHLPRFQAQTFLLNLQREVAPVTKAHYYLTRVKTLPITLLRVHIHDSPYNTQSSLQDTAATSISEGSRSIFVIFPDGSPFIYVSATTAAGPTTDAEVRSLRKVIIDAVPKALSRPQSRYCLQPTSLAAKSLTALLALRGAGRSTAAAGGWSIFAEDSFGHSALSYAPHKSNEDTEEDTNKDSTIQDKENQDLEAGVKRKRPISRKPLDPREQKRLKRIAAGRFGRSGLEDDGKGIERLDVRIHDAFPSDSASAPAPAPAPTTDTSNKKGRASRPSVLDKIASDDETDAEGSAGSWKPDVRLSFQGTHVFAGLRKLVEEGVVDGVKMPGWMTGEAGVSVGVVRQGRIVERKEERI